MSQRKCPICSNIIRTDEDTIPFKNRIAHISCFNSFIKVTSNEKSKKAEEKKAEKNVSNPKPIVELKEGLTEEEYKKKKSLFDKIRQIQDTDIVTAKTYKLVSDYMDKYKFTFIGIKQALEYFYGVQENETSNDCIGIVPYIYDEAQEFFSLSEKTIHNNIGLDLNRVDDLYQSKVIKVMPKKSKINLIDIEKLGEYDDEK